MRNRLIGAAIGVTVAIAALVLQSARAPRPIWNLLPESDGALKTVAFQYTRASSRDTKAPYEAFLSSISPTTHVIAVCGDAADATDLNQFIRSFPGGHPERVKVVVVGAPITGWCKDRFLVTSSSPAILLSPRSPVTGLASRDNDALVAGTIARSLPDQYHALPFPMYFDSGDIVATRRFMIVSDSLWRKNDGNRENDLTARSAFDRSLAAQFGLKVVHLHGVPDHHIGMFAAPLDDRTIIVGDPGLAKPMWNKTLETSLGVADFSPSVCALFDHAAAQLQAAGFVVVRAPLVYFGPQEYLTYTNAVFETSGVHRVVYMPWYDEPGLDAAGRAVYQSQGWEVRPIPVRTLYRHRGTIGCLINVLQRS